MNLKNVTQVYFSPGGTTQRVVECFTSAIADDAAAIDLLHDCPASEKQFGEDDFIVFAMPVFVGRIPSVCPAMLSKLKGQNTPAVAIAVYGNREYEDALLELCDILKANGFVVMGAAAFIARHSLFPIVAAGRPDQSDQQLIERFAQGCAKKMTAAKDVSGDYMDIKGNRPYREVPPPALIPSGNLSCIGCKVCVAVCPTQAISPEDPSKTDADQCIACTACVYACPQQARQFQSEKYRAVQEMFQKKCSVRKEPEVFL